MLGILNAFTRAVTGAPSPANKHIVDNNVRLGDTAFGFDFLGL